MLPRMSPLTARHGMMGPELFPEAASRALLGLANKVGCVGLTVAEKGILPLEEDTGAGTLAGRREGLSSAPPAACQGGSDLLQGCEERGRTGLFPKGSQREPGFPTSLVPCKLVSQILLRLAEARLLASLTSGCKQISEVLNSRSLYVNAVLHCSLQAHLSPPYRFHSTCDNPR